VLSEKKYPHVETLVAEVLAAWPEHRKYVDKSFLGRSEQVMAASDRLSDAIIQMSERAPGQLRALCDDYRYMSNELVLPEELHFRRHGGYRLKKFEDANRECYSNTELMRRYMNGLAISDVIWNNHAATVSEFAFNYLPSLKAGAEHLEVGPGHGFFLYFAAADPRVARLTGWDISPTSVEHTRRVLEILGVKKEVDLKVQDLFQAGSPPPGTGFDSIVMSEILEHLEDPHLALRSLSAWLRPGGKIWINVPINSPAPDHIYHFRDVEETHKMVRSCGLRIVDHSAFPMSGATLEAAIKRKLAISSVITAELN
jgi:2-polyprenyl-3-methyl-5-hydroxy-6-metoxy-1,4-benzoquinol methylase